MRASLERASALLLRLQAGTRLAVIAQELGQPISRIEGLSRNRREDRLGPEGVERAFSVPIGTPVGAAMPDGLGRVLILPVSANAPPPDPADEGFAALSAALSRALQADLVAEFVEARRNALSLTIDEAVFARALGQVN
jgi:peptidyl-prolyl cis-trans isomerase D